MEVTDPLEMTVQDLLGFDEADNGWRSARVTSALRRADDAQAWLLVLVLGGDERSTERVLRRWVSDENVRRYRGRYQRARRLAECFVFEDANQAEANEAAEEPQPVWVQHRAHGRAGDAQGEQDAG